MEPLKQFIKDVIQHLLDRTSQREKMAYYRHKTYHVEGKSMVLHEALPEPYGHNRDLLPDDTYVLIGYYKNEEHLKWILKSELYNTRTGTQNGSLPLSKELFLLAASIIPTKAKDPMSYDIGSFYFISNDSVFGWPKERPRSFPAKAVRPPQWKARHRSGQATGAAAECTPPEGKMCAQRKVWPKQGRCSAR